MGLSKDNEISYKYRKPDDEKEIFINYEFSQFISPIISTLGYYHRQYSDPRELNSFDLLDFFFDKTEKSNIIILTFIELASRHPELDIDVVNVEYRSGGRVKVKVFAQGKGDCSKLHSEYNQIYKHISSLSSQDVENLLSHISQQDRGLNVLKKTLESAGATKAYYSEIQQRLFNHLSKHEESSSKLILFFLANPKDTDRLRIDEEIRSIKEKLSPFIPSILKVVTQEATRGKDLTNALIRNRPKIVHFSAHGAPDEGLALEDDFGYMQVVSAETIAKLFYLFEGQVECVVLNACYTAIQAEVINQYVPYVIGMSRAIADQTAITFSTSFYSYLGEGFDIRKAFDLALNRLELEEMDDATVPVIKINTAIIPNQKPDHFDG
ncbi:CHAT domain-containing protein [Leptolyngbya cf. ectocarpi LEGE 11479]|uniref:CHAT domain-containing protein n=2 Tax=Leptolyngbya ectocarpi TaxID=1202 RepID=A0A928ZT78_LEPEC|nr:CHAT domain-containing protein [Leptolyngbya cf. ectocarpi LEGE 11479]